LPEDTRIYCAHEYTEANLRFARVVEPANRALEERQAEVQRLRQEGKATIPSVLAEELATNPFLRCHLACLVEAATRQAGSPVAPGLETFTVLRQWKNLFR